MVIILNEWGEYQQTNHIFNPYCPQFIWVKLKTYLYFLSYLIFDLQRAHTCILAYMKLCLCLFTMA